MNSGHSDKPRWRQVADRVGATAWFLGAIHGALLPFALVTCGGLFLAGARFANLHRDRQADAAHVHGAEFGVRPLTARRAGWPW